MTLREYARHRGVSLSSVQEAIKNNRIVVTKEEPHGCRIFKFLDSDQADLDWQQKTDLDQQRIPTRRQAGKTDDSICSPQYVAPDGEAQSFINDLIPEQSKPDPGKKKSEKSNEDVDSYYKDRALREKFAAKTAELEYWEKRNALVPKDALMVKLFNYSQTIQQNILNIPPRISPILAAFIRNLLDIQRQNVAEMVVVDEKEIQDIMNGELKQGMRKLADGKFDGL
jgi:plasmid maintenance system antidote protein VapI